MSNSKQHTVSCIIVTFLPRCHLEHCLNVGRLGAICTVHPGKKQVHAEGATDQPIKKEQLLVEIIIMGTVICVLTLHPISFI